jgi:tetratricopeptide (TPR) repeat protein
MVRWLAVLLLFVTVVSPCAGVPPPGPAGLPLPPLAASILDHIYSGRPDLAIPEARQLQQQQPNHPLGYLLEAEALWWGIWCTSADYRYGMTMARHREKQAGDRTYLNLATRASVLADAQLKQHETGEMHLYAAMADSLLARLYSLRWENRATARAGVRAREHYERALALDPSLADAYLGLGLYNYYVDTLSTMARILRFVMGIPGGSKEEGIRQLHLAMLYGQLTPAVARFYLAINLHNYDQRYEEALQVLRPLVEEYPQNPLFQLAIGDLYAKLGRKPQALEAYRTAAASPNMAEPACHSKIQSLVQASLAALGDTDLPRH